MAPLLSRLGATFEKVTSSPTTLCVTPTNASESNANGDDGILCSHPMFFVGVQFLLQ
jgi:hypothetical protein